ncbi:L10-interacting MYB domain-containing protein [Vitis vinifera]|uniref:L10-interacting MYB domain-containing protein n=1 Tax=Vitis vinifera TaxID=29760 RepID=A0A438DXZ2_VITVI|nr:L10-interacting MYB domain-containing protein [Vitis vinifera]
MPCSRIDPTSGRVDSEEVEIELGVDSKCASEEEGEKLKVKGASQVMTTEIANVEDVGTWRGNIEKIFIDIMVIEVNKGNMDSGTFSTNTWRRILLEINSQGKRNFNLKQLKQKFNRLRAMHREFFDILKHTGFGWDAETNMVHTLKETWKNYIWAHPNTKRFRSKGYPNYNLMGLIFNPSTTIGALHYSSTQDPPNTDDEDEMDDNLEHGGVHVDVDTKILDDLL